MALKGKTEKPQREFCCTGQLCNWLIMDGERKITEVSVTITGPWYIYIWCSMGHKNAINLPRCHLIVLLYCTVLYCTVLYCTVLYCTVLHCTVLYCTVLYCTVLHCTVLYCTVLYCTVLYCTALHCTVLYCTALHCTVLYCTVLYCTVLYCTTRVTLLPFKCHVNCYRSIEL